MDSFSDSSDRWDEAMRGLVRMSNEEKDAYFAELNALVESIPSGAERDLQDQALPGPVDHDEHLHEFRRTSLLYIKQHNQSLELVSHDARSDANDKVFFNKNFDIIFKFVKYNLVSAFKYDTESAQDWLSPRSQLLEQKRRSLLHSATRIMESPPSREEFMERTREALYMAAESFGTNEYDEQSEESDEPPILSSDCHKHVLNITRRFDTEHPGELNIKNGDPPHYSQLWATYVTQRIDASHRVEWRELHDQEKNALATDLLVELLDRKAEGDAPGESDEHITMNEMVKNNNVVDGEGEPGMDAII